MIYSITDANGERYYDVDAASARQAANVYAHSKHGPLATAVALHRDGGDGWWALWGGDEGQRYRIGNAIQVLPLTSVPGGYNSLIAGYVVELLEKLPQTMKESLLRQLMWFTQPVEATYMHNDGTFGSRDERLKYVTEVLTETLPSLLANVAVAIQEGWAGELMERITKEAT